MPVPPSRLAAFAIALPIYRVFDYEVEAGDPLRPGTRYRLPFGSGTRTGVLLDPAPDSEVDPDKIRPAGPRLDDRPVLDEHMLALARWLAEYYLQPLGEVIFLCLPLRLHRTESPPADRVKRWRLVGEDPAAIEALARRSPRQYEICCALASGGMTAADLKALNPNWHAAVRALERRGLVAWAWDEPGTIELPAFSAPTLSAQQTGILDSLGPRLGGFGVHLLDGITGSGKTEIYLHLIRETLDAGQQVIYLVPEIGLTDQLIERVRERFGDCFELSHSGLTESRRYRAWDRFRRGERRIMLGTRSSLFAQCNNLGLIVIDEEHDSSYRQEDGVRYHARDVAIKRAQMLDIPVLLGSATPSTETLRNCARDNWYTYRLDQRPTRYPPPALQLVDLRHGRIDFGIAGAVFERIDTHLEQGGQVLIYLNRRGFAPVVMCHECGWQAVCANCDSRLTLHQSVGSLLCHHCGYADRVPEACPQCGNPEIRHYGVGTEQLEQGLVERYPQIPILRIDRDVIASREALQSRLEQLRTGDPCILIGTQMIAKGHDYPAITLSVVLDADQALFSAAYRAPERLAQTLFQVAGRAGRGDRPGEALVQSRFPGHPLLRALVERDYRDVVGDLLHEREQLGFPPYARVTMFRADAPALDAALACLQSIREILARTPGIEALTLIGPMPALMTRRIGRYRAQLCLLAPAYASLREVLARAMPEIAELSAARDTNWIVDVDAQDL
ncbi:MAG: primosomal protein N' [Gammaproteobacteria bacterium]|nr:primosomal protein N' [Gammaproteobacteria bacterium]